MSVISYQQFLKTLPAQVLPLLPAAHSIKAHQPFRWIVQFYDQDKRIHYEVQRIAKRKDFELGLHFESKNKKVNAHLLRGFSRRMFEVHARLGDSIVAEPWDRGWAKVYDVYAGPASSTGSDKLTTDYQVQLGARLAAMISCLHPMLHEILDDPIASIPPVQKQGVRLLSF